MDTKPLDLDRTWICCVLFADIASYSKHSIEQQIDWKFRFNNFLNEALLAVEPDARYILDTGDGAAICFLGAPEPAMQTALKLRYLVIQARGARAEGMRIRLGINLGPLRLMKDVNGVVNAVGDAINVSQRVMSFADLDQILVSRSFHETVSCLSEENARMFAPAGTRTDKHGRAHVVYELAPVSSAPVASLFQQSDLKRLRSLLTPVLGPIADRLVNQEAAQSDNIAALSQRLMAHLPAGSAREAFAQKCQAEFVVQGPTRELSKDEETSARPKSSAQDTAFNDRATKELARFIGPVAKIIVAKTAKLCGSKDEFLDMLSQEISSTKDRENFRNSMLRTWKGA